MASQPLFSVIIPTLGKVGLWKQAIHSVLAQSFKDFEIIAIDSGPQENSLPIVNSFNDGRIKYVNTGGGNPRLNWDAGFLHSRGKFIIWVDDDDYMLPFELSCLAEAIQKTKAEIVTGEHLHWRNTAFLIRKRKNELVMQAKLFSGLELFVDPKDVIRLQFGLPLKSKLVTRAGWANSAIKRELIEAVRKRIGKLDWGSTSTHAFRVGLYAIAKAVFFIDKPVLLKCESGFSMKSMWPRDSSEIKHAEFHYALSPVHGNTYSNYMFENHLLAKRAFAEELKELPLDTTRFLKNTYARDLAFLKKQSWKDLKKNWLEFYSVAKNSTDPDLRSFRPTIILYSLAAIAVKLLRYSGIFQLIQEIKAIADLRANDATERERRIAIPLEKYNIQTIQECALKLPEIIEKELKIKYEAFIHSTAA